MVLHQSYMTVSLLVYHNQLLYAIVFSFILKVLMFTDNRFHYCSVALSSASVY